MRSLRCLREIYLWTIRRACMTGTHQAPESHMRYKKCQPTKIPSLSWLPVENAVYFQTKYIITFKIQQERAPLSSTSLMLHEITLPSHLLIYDKCSSSSSQGLNLGFLLGSAFNHAIERANEPSPAGATTAGTAAGATGDVFKLPTSLKLGNLSKLPTPTPSAARSAGEGANAL